MSDQQFIKYTTRENQRLDQIAHAVYGDSNRWKDIIDANPTMPIIANYSAGLVLRIPIVSTTDDNFENENLPPWKQ